jgi:hypothetical protein
MSYLTSIGQYVDQHRLFKENELIEVSKVAVFVAGYCIRKFLNLREPFEMRKSNFYKEHVEKRVPQFVNSACDVIDHSIGFKQIAYVASILAVMMIRPEEISCFIAGSLLAG